MRPTLTVLACLSGLLTLLAGVGFLVDPVAAIGEFGLEVADASGRANMRADMAALFFIVAGCAIRGAVRRNGDLLLVAVAFYALTQADESFSRIHGGAGIGLTLCSRQTRLLGGALSVKSSPGEGTRSTLSFDRSILLGPTAG